MYIPTKGLYWPIIMDFQGLTLDRSQAKLFDLARHALRPVNLEVIIEPYTGDRVFFLEFEDRATMAIRQSAEDVIRTKLTLLNAEARSLQ